MSNLTPPASNSRSSSPGGAGGDAKPRAVSGSLKDRIAKFNNPSAAPLMPTHAFGTAGPTMPSSASQRGLIGNRIPSLDPKTAGMIGSQGQRKVSDNKGLIGNRVPSTSAPNSGSTSNFPGRNVGGASARSSSPGSVTSSSNYQPGSSTSPHTSRSSSPPTSIGGGLPPSLLVATLPDTGGPGTTTPSSTRADIGEETTELSPPATPTAATEMPPQDDNMIRSDLTPNNLPANVVAKNPMLRTLSGAGGVAPSITSSMASQYDSKGGSEDQTKMMQDVSGISTPTGTPRAAHRELGDERSLAGSVRGPGSVREGSVADFDDLKTRLEGLDASDRDQEGEGEIEGDVAAPEDGDETNVPDVEMKDEALDSQTPTSTDEHEVKADTDNDVNVDTVTDQDLKQDTAAEIDAGPVAGEGPNDHPEGIVSDPTAKIDSTVTDEVVEGDGKAPGSNEDPNLDADLDDLKEGNLERGDTHQATEASEGLLNNLVETSFTQGVVEEVVAPSDVKHQGGEAGQIMEDVENADEVIQPGDDSKATKENDGPEINEVPSDNAGSEKREVEDATSEQVTTKSEDPIIGETSELDPLGQDKQGVQSAESEQSDQQIGSDEAEPDASTYDTDKDLAQIGTPTAASEGDGATGEVADNVPSAIDEATEEDPSASTLDSKPIQVQIEPAPIAQPADEPETTKTPESAPVADTSDEPTPNAEIEPPTFPAPPSEDPDVVDPISQADSGAVTPLDPAITRAFPDVPDEDKPRVQVHVSSPLNTPQKEKTSSTFTPLADLPGKSKSLSSLAAESASEDDHEAGSEVDTPKGNKHKRRLSARKSPKSPLLDDEDPGDFEPGEGWAVVTKGREI